MTLSRNKLNREQAAQYLTDMGYRYSRHTLAALASRGEGPRYYKQQNRVFYQPADLEAWVKSTIVASA